MIINHTFGGYWLLKLINSLLGETNKEIKNNPLDPDKS